MPYNNYFPTGYSPMMPYGSQIQPQDAFSQPQQMNVQPQQNRAQEAFCGSRERQARKAIQLLRTRLFSCGIRKVR